MGSIRVRKSTKTLFFDFRYQGQRCREQTTLLDSPTNRRKMQKILTIIEQEIALGTFDYTSHFPGKASAGRVVNGKEQISNGQLSLGQQNTPTFAEFAELWLGEMRIQWRETQYYTVENALQKHLLPVFGEQRVGHITKGDILAFRSGLAKVPGRKGKTLSASRINHILTPLRMILNEAANRFEFTAPYHGIKSLKVPRTDVEPFSLEEVDIILRNVRADFRDYYLIRFFTGLRTSEIDGLRWEKVDLARRQILVHEALVKGQVVPTKNDGSFRTVEMSLPVHQAFQALHEIYHHKDQAKRRAPNDYVFSTREGTPLRHDNVTKRVWYPLLRYLDLKARRPYQTRHTAATLWLASGESPEWIARQMGHSTTEMLFRVYSRYVPNLTRQDGSAMERLLLSHLSLPSEVGHD
ncbi:site-specific integrase [Acidithiobacillus thiooxidans]|uniref:site-specific integrase n=1 Tax=Acidithiobacillus thiooxidans TaxID=930 RepID=UPI002859A498|nr:site-specific integrase [Acidithiobacillus thiooxidans]MDR7928812.1 site-specific integrase [Acidithiobacillus thiooxidans]